MMRPRLVLAAVLAIVTSPAAAGAPIRGAVTRVIDGDSLVVGRTEIRLCGIDAPELSTRAGKRSAKTARQMMIGRAARCVAVGDGTPCDGRSYRRSYDRIVAQCFVGGVDVARQLVRRRAACDWPRFSGGAYRTVGGCER
ncbi:thermonuclease family protein [Aurantimonas sp. VKM B-3413]|uniref:thermonuclease family protein n=1 Tax=Aurantimonas sp. VKM B-3413 TaxID=2779401 RepID=UPI001E307EA7|nr:thermonuclease family protein [Aurantimonas sp. VKM B-3413]MCB8835913.1 thermonuclease family protein [Aurantimonas sp. VKM B-3413]